MPKLTVRSSALLFSAFALILPLSAIPVYQGGTGAVTFGVGQYGGGAAINPSFILNNVYNVPGHVMTSPGGQFQTVNTSVVNNVAEFVGILPGGATWAGGGNGNGTFGSGTIVMNGNAIGFGLTDNNADGGGVAAYAIGSWQSTYVDVGGFNGTIGNWLGVAGSLPTLQSAAAVSLNTRLVINGNIVMDLPSLILAGARNGNFVAAGGGGGWAGGAVVAFGGGNTTWSGLAVNRQGIVLNNGDVIVATSTLTAIADPASFNSDLVTDLFQNNPSLFTPEFTFNPITTVPETYNSFNQVPEPGTWAMMGLAFAGLAVRRLRK